MLNNIWSRVRRNPALIGAALLWAYETLSTGDALTWQGVITVAVGVAVRSKVVPANEVFELVDDLLDVTGEAAEEG